MSNVLVTGGLGFIGRELTKSLLADKREVTLLVRDGTQNDARKIFPKAIEVITLEDLIHAPHDRVFETIFHLATVYVYENTVEDIPKIIDANIELPTTLADISCRWGKKVQFVNVSTFMQHFQGSSYSPTCLYAATKKSIEDILFYYSNSREEFTVANLVFPHIYGEGDTRNKLLNLLINAAKNKQPLHLASGNQLLDLVHVSDAVEALKIAEKSGNGRWSITSDECFSIKELSQIICDLSKVNLEINFDLARDRKYDTFEIWETADGLPNWIAKVKLKEWLSTQFINQEDQP